MPTLGLYMIAKNEEEVIERCLSSFIGDGSIFDQVVLVDTGSTDRTKEIAKKFGCEVYDFKWVNDFSKARNFSLSKVKTTYAMWCDLDDVLLEKDFQKLKQLKPNLSKDMYLLPYDYFQDENGKSLCTLYRERIIKNNPKFTWNYPIHECMAMLPGASVEQVEIIITHKRTNAGQTADLSRNIKMLDEAIKKPEYAKDPRVQYYLAKECFDACQWERATTELSKFIDMNSGWYEDVICALHKLAECYRVTAKNDLAKQIAFKAIGMDYKWAEPYYVLGMIAMDAKDWKQAIHWFEMCRRPLPQVLSPTRPDYYTWLPNLQLCVCYNAVGDLQKSHERNAEALKQNPKNATIIQNDKWLKKTLSTKNNSPKEIKVGWYVLGIDLNVPQFRIRTHNINKHLQGCKSEIFTDASRIKEFDVIIFDVMFNERDYNVIVQAKDMGKCALVNVCEALFEFNNPWYTKSMEIADIVICCSEALKKLVSEKVPTAKITCHEDAVETDYRTNCSYEDKQSLVVGWCGMGGGAYRVEKLRPLFEKHGYKLVTIHEHANADIKWDLNTWQSELVKCDIAVAPTDYLIQPCKSNNKLTTYMALGLPVICSPLHAYARLVNDGQNAFIADNDEQWERALIALKDVNVRRSVGQAGKAISHAYSLPVIASYWRNTIVDCFSKMDKQQEQQQQQDVSVDIIIPTYDNPQYLEECIKSVKECTDVPYNIIVVDAKAEKTNFSQSINLGISRGNAPYICLLNDDVIVSKGWIRPLIEQVKGNIGFVNPLSNCDKGWLHNYEMNGWMPGTHKLEQINPQDVYNFKSPSTKVYERDWIAFYATMTSREVINKVGLLDEEYKTGSEDLDYCIRAGKFGYKCAVNENSFVFHFGGISRKRHEDEDPQKHVEEDRYNNNRIQFKYSKSLVVIQTGYAFEKWGADCREKGLGGSEQWAVYLAEAMAKQGVRVVVFAPTGKEVEIVNGVEWYDSSKWDKFISMNYIDVCIVSRYVNFFETPIRAGKKYLFVHDIFALCAQEGDRDRVREQYNNLDGIFVLCPWHRDFFADYHKVSKDKIIIFSHGLDLKRFEK